MKVLVSCGVRGWKPRIELLPKHKNKIFNVYNVYEFILFLKIKRTGNNPYNARNICYKNKEKRLGLSGHGVHFTINNILLLVLLLRISIWHKQSYARFNPSHAYPTNDGGAHVLSSRWLGCCSVLVPQEKVSVPCDGRQQRRRVVIHVKRLGHTRVTSESRCMRLWSKFPAHC